MSGGAAFWERELVARICAGDDSAFAELYDQFSPLVYGVALRVTGSPVVAADATQEVFVGFWERPDRFDAGRGSLRSYLSVAGRRRAIDALRRSSRAVRGEQRVAEQAPMAPPDVEEAAAALVTGERVRRAVDALPAEQRRAIELAYFAGLTFVEVAARLGIPEGTAKSRLRLGLAKLAATLRSDGSVQWA